MRPRVSLDPVDDQPAGSQAENTAAMAMPVTLEYAYNGFPPNRSTYRSPFGVIRCPDAWVCFWLYNHAWVGLCDALGRSELITDPRFVTAEISLDEVPERLPRIGQDGEIRAVVLL